MYRGTFGREERKKITGDSKQPNFCPIICGESHRTRLLERVTWIKPFLERSRHKFTTRSRHIFHLWFRFSSTQRIDFTTLWKKISVGVFSIKVLQLKHQALEVGCLTPQPPRVSADLRILRSLDGRASSICASAALLPRQTQRFHDSKTSGM